MGTGAHGTTHQVAGTREPGLPAAQSLACLTEWAPLLAAAQGKGLGRAGKAQQKRGTGARPPLPLLASAAGDGGRVVLLLLLLPPLMLVAVAKSSSFRASRLQGAGWRSKQHRFMAGAAVQAHQAAVLAQRAAPCSMQVQGRRTLKRGA